MSKFNFEFGKKRKSAIQWASFSLILTTIVVSLHQCTGVSEKNIWNLIDQTQRELTKKGVKLPEEINDYIINTPELLNQRIKGDIDNAIQQYEIEEKRLYKPNMKNEKILKEIERPIYTETQRQIIKDAVYYECSNGSMGIHAVWYNSKKCNY